MRKVKIKLSSVLLVLVSLTFLSIYLLCGMLAKYVTTGEDGDSARVAVWSVELTGNDADKLTISADDSAGYAAQEGTWYAVTVKVNASNEAMCKYGITVTFEKDGSTSWPAGVTAKLLEGNTEIAENTTGIFSDLGTVAPGGEIEKTYTLCVKADTSALGGKYKMKVAATIEQLDTAPANI